MSTFPLPAPACLCSCGRSVSATVRAGCSWEGGMYGWIKWEGEERDGRIKEWRMENRERIE